MARSHVTDDALDEVAPALDHAADLPAAEVTALLRDARARLGALADDPAVDDERERDSRPSGSESRLRAGTK